MNLQLIILLFLVASLYIISTSIQLSLIRLFSSAIRFGKAVVYVVWFIYFPGILIHELSHLISAYALFLKVKSIHLLPVLTTEDNGEKSIKFGSVTYYKADPIRGLLVGIAPFFLGSLVLILLFHYFPFPQEKMIYNVFFVYASFVISSTMFSSKQDLQDLMYVIPSIILIFLVFYFINFNPLSYITLSVSLQKDGIGLVNHINNMFSISLIINLIIYAIVRIIRR